MSIKFWLGGAGGDSSRQLIKFITDEAEKHPDRQYLVIVPEQFGLATQQELVACSKNGGILNIDVLSFSRFAHRISDEVGSYKPDVIQLSETGKSLLIGMLAARRKKDLTVFADDLDKPGYIDKIKSQISEFMQYGISVEKAFELSERAAAGGRGLLAGKLHDVSLIYGDFKEYIKDRYTTVEETLDTVSLLIHDSDTVKNSVIAFDGFTGFTPLQYKLIGTLMEYAPALHFGLLFENCIQKDKSMGRIEEHELFYLSKYTMNRLGRMADERHMQTEDPYIDDKFALSNTCDSNEAVAYTFGTRISKLNNTPEQILYHVCSAHTPIDEVKLVRKKITDLITKNGYRYRDIAIMTGDIASYRHIVEHELGRHDIPFFIDVTQPVLMNPFIDYIRSFIDIISDNYSEDAVFRFLKSPLSGFSDDEVSSLENYCLAANIRGYKKWHERFDMHTQAAGADELLTLNDIRERFTSKTDRFTGYLDKGSSGKARINAGSKFSVRHFATALYLVIEEDGIEDALKKAADDFERLDRPELSAEYGKIYVQIMNVLDELCDLIPDEITDIRGFGDLVDAGLESISIGILPKGMDYIQVADLTRSRLNDVKALFIIGAKEGVIPRISSGGGILNDSDRNYLTGGEDGTILAPTCAQDIYTQQLYIYMAANKPKEHLFISYSHMSSSGKSIRPSFIVGKLKELHPEAVSDNDKGEDYYSDEEEAFTDLAGMISPAISGTIQKDTLEKAKVLIGFFKNSKKYTERLERLERSLRDDTEDITDSIGSALARAIYGKNLNENITKLEKYAGCAYSYFLNYALSLREREIFSFEARDMGNIFHDSMKEYGLLMQEEGHDWKTVTVSEREKLMNRAVDKVIDRIKNEKLSSSAKYAYVEQRIRRIMQTSAQIVCEQIKKGNFTPGYFEVDFERMDIGDSLSIRLSDDEMMRLRGRIDRVDMCETDDGIYVRVIDYKSSKHSLDLAAVYEGRQLQLLVYLGAAIEECEKKAQNSGNGKAALPAGAFYYTINDPIVPEKEPLSETDIHKGIMKSLCLHGFVNSDPIVLNLMDEDIASDPTVLGVEMKSDGELKKSREAVSGEDLQMLTEYAMDRVRSMGEKIISGDISIPSFDGKERFSAPPCKYCAFTDVCDNKRGSYRFISDKTEKKKDEEWLAMIRQRLGKDETD